MKIFFKSYYDEIEYRIWGFNLEGSIYLKVNLYFLVWFSFFSEWESVLSMRFGYELNFEII